MQTAVLIAGVEDPENELIKPAAQGTKNVLSSAVKSKDTVKRVIVTSSFAGLEMMLVSCISIGLIASCMLFFAMQLCSGSSGNCCPWSNAHARHHRCAQPCQQQCIYMNSTNKTFKGIASAR